MTSALAFRSPGPASYNLPSEFGTKKGPNRFSFTGKPRQLHKTDNEPGPDKYSNTTSTLGGQKWSMGARPPKHERLQSEPGPGRYFEKGIPSTIGHGPKYSLTGKLHNRSTHIDDVPAPNKYDISLAKQKTQFNPPAFSISKKTEYRLRENDSTPGPGAHNIEKIDPIGKQGPRISLTGKPKVDDRLLKHRAEMPGPGQYAGVNRNLTGTNGPRFSFGRKYRDGINQGYFTAPRTVVPND